MAFVKRTYIRVPAPAPKSAATVLICTLPQSYTPEVIMGTAMVAAIIASSCWNAKTISLPNFGLSLIP